MRALGTKSINSSARCPARWRQGNARAACRPPLCRVAAPRCTVCQSAVSDVFVLDFDGVIVDSEPEITASAFEAAAQRWPDLFGSVQLSAEQRSELREAMRTVRPVLVRGYESMVMLRLLHRDPACPATAAAILERWPQELDRALAEWGESAEELNALYEAVRNDWMTNRADSWMALQVPYEGVAQALRDCPFPTYIASSKAGHRVSALSRAVLGLDLPPDSLFASLLPPEEKKAEALSVIASRPLAASPSTRLHFVDDRLDTLAAVQRAQGPAGRWSLYLADWGYNTAAERAAAASTPGIRLLSLRGFRELLAFGLAMGVDDGCEPTAEEVAAGV